MKQERNSKQKTAERTIQNICRATRRQYWAEEQLRITREGLPCDELVIYPTRRTCAALSAKKPTHGRFHRILNLNGGYGWT